MKIGVLMYTYNRTDDARINMEIIRNYWSANEFFKNVTIVHSYNGEKEWWPEKYLEDELLCLENPGHFSGAETLLNEGIECFKDKYSEIDYVIILASDTWCMKPEYIKNLIQEMQREEKYIATCTWGTKEKNSPWKMGMSLDFSIVDIKWSVKSGLFPIRYKEFLDKYSDLFYYRDETIYPERVFALRFKEAILGSVKLPSENLLRKVSEAHVLRMKEREPVHDVKNFWGITKKGRKMYWSTIGLITHHEPMEKKKVFKKYGFKLGEYSEKFLNSSDLSYYNRGLDKTNYIKGSKKIDYGD